MDEIWILLTSREFGARILNVVEHLNTKKIETKSFHVPDSCSRIFEIKKKN